ncbi:DsbA family protein [Corynebacterium halotolerans]|uniref:DsbA family protein n=1 Tax=Corynebacterium halotolerans TaxID=225326 RepID=UPI00034C709A|nr:thioredoxin domain-containing protein [Corynebacterium halotolerans]
MARGSDTRRSRKNTWVVPAIIIAVAVVLIGIVVVMSRDTGSAGAGPQTAAGAQVGPEVPSQGGSAQEPAGPDLTAVETRDETDPLAVGPVDAPVGLVVFSDYQCPYCAKWSAETLPAMMEYAKAGDLRIEWRDLNLFGPASERASRAAYAAALQGEDAYLEYHHALFNNGENRSEEQLSDEALIALAGDLGLDTEAFTADFHAPETAEVVAGNAQLGPDLGVYSTPAFILGGQPIMGAQPTEVFLGAVEPALSDKE